MDELGRFAAFARTLADAARAETLPRWRGAGEARNKAQDGSFNPVTEADVASEGAMRALIEAEFPDHGIAAEELDDRPAFGPWCWSLDPIDGTRSFVCGMPSWVTLIALLRDGEPVLGLIDAPRLGERYIGFGSTALLEDRDGQQQLRVSGCRRLADARLSATDPYMFGGADAEAFERVRRASKATRWGHDGYAYARLAAGSVDLVVEAGLQPYDYNAVVPVIGAAGGLVGNWQGGEDLSDGSVVAAATRELFEEAVTLLRRGG
jgi:histidinol phosphatase-like enzyme (inositol monophosphatase family)